MEGGDHHVVVVDLQKGSDDLVVLLFRTEAAEISGGLGEDGCVAILKGDADDLKSALPIRGDEVFIAENFQRVNFLLWVPTENTASMVAMA